MILNALNVILVRYLHPADNNPVKFRNVDKLVESNSYFKDIKFPIEIRDIHKIEKKKKNCISISVFGYKKKEKYPIYVSKNTFKRHIDLLLIGEEGKRHYVLIKDFNTCMYDTYYIVKENSFVIIIYKLLV